MRNERDVQYHADINVGGQTITGIMDTGSFELVVFAAGCSTCGRAGAFNETGSPTFQRGKRTQIHSYGSGSCKSKDGRDSVEIGCYSARDQAMWVAMDCQMPVLKYATFNAIIGVAPPGQPEMRARHILEQAKQIEDGAHATGAPVPPHFEEEKVKVQEMLEDALTKTELLETLGSNAFSVCLGKEPGSEGFFIWNDVDRRGQPGVITFPVVGAMTWSVKVTSVSLHFSNFKKTVGCESGCGTIVDTGTSLIAMPSNTFNRMAQYLRAIDYSDCSDLVRFPDLVITVDGNELRVPPSAYLGKVEGRISAAAAPFMHMGALQGDQEQPHRMCELLVMDSGTQNTDFGPLLILGMPFFREYYTTFHLGKSREERSISVAPADAQCNPNVSPLTQAFRTTRSSTATTPRIVDGPRLRGPHWLSSHEGTDL